jgi:hypothetical protein
MSAGTFLGINACEDCVTCEDCGRTVCLAWWPPLLCTHGHTICTDCAPGSCPECVDLTAKEAAL